MRPTTIRGLVGLKSLLLLVAATAAVSAAPLMDRIERHHSIALDDETPHTKWAKPYAGGTVRALFIVEQNPNINNLPLRHIVELRQRFDVEGDAVLVMTAKGNTYAIMYPGESGVYGSQTGEKRLAARLVPVAMGLPEARGSRQLACPADRSLPGLRRRRRGAGLHAPSLFFPKARVDEGTEALSALIEKLRARADEAAQKKGRPQGLAVRVPSYEPACAEVGLDWRTWVREGWIDVLTASCFMSAEHEADLAPFVEGCRESGTQVHWCIESAAGFPNVEYRNTLYFGGAPTGPSAEHYRAMALGAYEQGVDGLYFFNFHFPFERCDTHPDVGFLREMHDPQLLRGRDHTYLVSRQTHDSEDSFFACAPARPTPATLTTGRPQFSFAITIGADLERAAAAKTLRSARLRLCLRGLTPLDTIAVMWDGEELAGRFDPPVAAGTWQQFNGLHFWVADLAASGRAPKRGKHECTVRLIERNPQIEEGIIVDFADLDVRFWRKPGKS